VNASPLPVREHILCVDDEEGILAALRQQLSARFGGECDIAVAKNAREALELIDDLQQDGEELAVVIADQIMPGMKGVELLEEVHKRSPRTVKILLTGQAGLDAVVYAINRAGLDQYIPKPWDEPDLRLTIQNFLSRFRLERERQELLSELKSKNAELATLKVVQGNLVANEAPDDNGLDSQVWVFQGNRVLERPRASAPVDRAAASLAGGPRRTTVC